MLFPKKISEIFSNLIFTDTRHSSYVANCICAFAVMWYLPPPVTPLMWQTVYAPCAVMWYLPPPVTPLMWPTVYAPCAVMYILRPPVNPPTVSAPFPVMWYSPPTRQSSNCFSAMPRHAIFQVRRINIEACRCAACEVTADITDLFLKIFLDRLLTYSADKPTACERFMFCTMNQLRSVMICVCRHRCTEDENNCVDCSSYNE